LQINNCKFKILLATTLFCGFIACSIPQAHASNIQETDYLRYELSTITDKNSKEYIKAKLKLENFIKENKIDYSSEARLNDCRRLIKEQKFHSAIYELNELISIGYKEYICNELLGDICLKYLRNAQKALKYYEKSLNIMPDNPTCAYKAARIYFDLKNNVQGFENIKTIIKNTNDEQILGKTAQLLTNKVQTKNRLEANNVYELLGQVYLKLKSPKKAIYNFEQALRLNPEDMHLRYYLGTLLQENEEYEDALVLYDSILKTTPNDTQIRFSKAKIYENTNRAQNAIEEYKSILNIYPTSAQAQYALFNLLRYKCSPSSILKEINVKNLNYTPKKEDYDGFANFLEQMNDIEGAKIFRAKYNKLTQEENLKKEKAKKEKPSKQTITNKQPELLSKENISQKPQKKEIIQKQEENTPAQKNTAKKEVNQQKEIVAEKKPIQTQQQKNIKTPKQDTSAKQAFLQEKTCKDELEKIKLKNPQKYKEYMTTIAKYQAMQPKTAEIYVAIANTYKMMNAQNNAIENFKKAIKLSPVESDLYYNLGLTYLELNDTSNAKTNLTKAINLNTDNSKAQTLLSFVNQKIITKLINDSYTLFEHNKYIEALELLDSGIKEYKNNSQLYYYRALVYNAMNRNAAQIIDLQKAVELDSTNHMAFYQLGLAYEKINDERSALVAFERFLSTEPDEKELIDEVQKKVILYSKKYY